eukprot:8905936-Alexandrium_andersonii.AAC.1
MEWPRASRSDCLPAADFCLANKFGDGLGPNCALVACQRRRRERGSPALVEAGPPLPVDLH